MAFIADDVTYSALPANPATGQSRYVGKDQFRALLETLLSQNTQVEPIGSIVVKGERVSMHRRISQKNLTQRGIDWLEVDGDYVVRDGKLQFGIAAFTPESLARLDAVRTPPSQPARGQVPPAGDLVTSPTSVLLALSALGVLGAFLGFGYGTLRRR